MSRFAKGQSGNPGGRPRKARAAERKDVSPFAVIFEQMIVVREGNGTRELGAEEALHLKTYQKALAGSRLAQRAVMKMIEKRQAWNAKHRWRPNIITLRASYHDKEYRASLAMEVLGIATLEKGADRDKVLLEPWAVEAALKRRRGKLERIDIPRIRVATRDYASLDLSRYSDD